MRLKINVQLITESGEIIKEIKREEEIAPKRNAPKWTSFEKVHYNEFLKRIFPIPEVYEIPETAEVT